MTSACQMGSVPRNISLGRAGDGEHFSGNISVRDQASLTTVAMEEIMDYPGGIRSERGTIPAAWYSNPKM